MDNQASLCWLQRCQKEELASKHFWKDEEKKQQKRLQHMTDGASSVTSVPTSTRVNSDTTISTLVLKDKLKKLEDELKREQEKMTTLTSHFSNLRKSESRLGTPAKSDVLRVAGTAGSRAVTPLSTKR